MNLVRLRALKHSLNSLFYSVFDNLTPDQRLSFQNQIEEIDVLIAKCDEF